MIPHMTPSQSSLWSKLESLTIGDPAASLDFARRLARDNNWPLPFARRAIDEYKRFLFLAMEAGHPVTPSDEVDQAWHLHLVYTDSYWNQLCRDILPRPLHHGPTKGGTREGDKFNDWYSRTLRSYQRFFGHAPPPDLWPDSSIRFGLAPHFRRINTADNWIIPKRLPRTAAAFTVCGILSLALIGCGLGLAQSAPGFPSGLIATIVIVGGAVAAIGLLALLVGRALSRAGHPRSDQTGGSGYGFLWVGGSDSGTSHGKSGCATHDGKSGCGAHHNDGGSSGGGGDSGSSGSDGGGGSGGDGGGGGSGCGGGGCGGS